MILARFHVIEANFDQTVRSAMMFADGRFLRRFLRLRAVYGVKI